MRRTPLRLVAVIALFVFCSARASHGFEQERQRTINPEEMHMYNNFHSKFLAKDRTVLVWMPPGYNTEKTRRYPVLYMQDGGSAFVDWYIDEVAMSLVTAKEIEPLIIVLVYNGGTVEDRFDEYTPTWDSNVRRGGKADQYGQMLVEELKPFIDENYRTLRDASQTGLGGVSLGGLATLYLGLKYPSVFGKLAIMSPSIWWDNRIIMRSVKELKAKPEARIWLDIGTEESRGSIQDVRELRKALTAKGWVPDKDLMYLEAKGGTHDDKSFFKRVAPFLKFLFPPQAKVAESVTP